MICLADGCDRATSTSSASFCMIHTGNNKSGYYHNRWDRDRWDDRVEMLHAFREKEEPEMQRKIIRDLLRHAGDVVE